MPKKPTPSSPAILGLVATSRLPRWRMLVSGVAAAALLIIGLPIMFSGAAVLLAGAVCWRLGDRGLDAGDYLLRWSEVRLRGVVLHVYCRLTRSGPYKPSAGHGSDPSK